MFRMSQPRVTRKFIAICTSVALLVGFIAPSSAAAVVRKALINGDTVGGGLSMLGRNRNAGIGWRKGFSALAVSIAAMLMLQVSAWAADWPNSRNDPANTGSSAETLPLPLTERWHSTAPLVEENGAVVSNGVVYMSTADGQLYAFIVATGAVATGFPVTTSSNFGAPAVDAVNQKVYALAGSTLFAFNLDGTSAWTAPVGAAGSNFNVGPIVEAGFVYLTAGGNLHKYDSAGTQQWSVPAGGNDTQPAIMGGFVYVNTQTGQVRKYDKATGAEVVTGGFPIATAGSQAGLAVANGRIFHKADQLYAYDATTGATVWTAAAGGDSTFYDSPAVSNGAVYVYGWDSKLYAFDEATGATMAGFPSVDLATPQDRNWSSPTVADDKVFVGAGTSQRLNVLGAAGTANAGVVLAEYPTFSADPQGFDLTSPVVSDGFVLAMLDGGGLYAFGSGGGGSIIINGGAACTDSQNVTLTIDPGSNTEMRISEDPFFTAALFEPVATSKAFTLSPGFGTKTVYIQFRDSSGQLSNVFNDDIEYAASCISKKSTSTSYTGGASVQYSDAVTLSGTLLDTSGVPVGIAGKQLDFTLGTQTASASPTDAGGNASTSLTVTQLPGSVTTVATAFAGDATYAASNDSDPFAITKEDCTLAYTGDTLVNAANMTKLSAQFGEPDASPGVWTNKTITFTVTDSLLIPHVFTATTDALGVASTTAALGPDVYSVGVSFAGDGYYLPCASSADTLVTVSAAAAKITGGGWISQTVGNTSFGFNVIQDVTGLHGQLQIRVKSGKDRFHSTSVLTLNSTANSGTWTGTGRWNGVDGYTFTISVVDNGTSGKKGDTISILIMNSSNVTVFTTNGAQPLKGGNIVVH